VTFVTDQCANDQHLKPGCGRALHLPAGLQGERYRQAPGRRPRVGVLFRQLPRSRSPVRERRIPSDPGNQQVDRPTPGRRGDCQPDRRPEHRHVQFGRVLQTGYL